MTKKTTTKPKPVECFYARCSSKDGHFQNQLKKMKERWGDLPLFTETVSGGKNRAVLNHLLATLPEGSTIFVAHEDRLSRAGILDFLTIVERARTRKISVFTMHGDSKDLLDQDPIFLALKAYVAEQERMATSRRMKDAVARIRKEKYDGKWGGGLAKEKGTHSWGTKPVNPVFQEALPFLQELRSQGHSYDKIVEMAGIQYGQKFSKAHVYRLLNKKD